MKDLLPDWKKLQPMTKRLAPLDGMGDKSTAPLEPYISEMLRGVSETPP